jgi:hypothetical protein
VQQQQQQQQLKLPLTHQGELCKACDADTSDTQQHLHVAFLPEPEWCVMLLDQRCLLLCSLPSATSMVMCQLLHLPSITPPPLSMRQLLGQQDATSSATRGPDPVLFIITPGADPTQELAAFAEAQVLLAL